MTSKWKARRGLALVLGSLCASAATGCGADQPREAVEVGEDGEPLYAVSTMLFDDTSATSYVAFVDSLGRQSIDLDTAAEFQGWSSIATSDGALFVGGGEAPEITRYAVSEKGTLGEGKRLSFAKYGLGSVSFSYNAFVEDSVAHLRLEETSRIVWDQKSLSITGSVEAKEIARERDGLTVSASNFEGIHVREDGVFWPYFWHDEDWYEFHQHSSIAIYESNGSLAKQLDVPCPALNIASADEEGNIYFSGMVDTLAHQLVEKDSTLERCVAKVNAGEQTIAEGWPRRFEELTDGRPAGRFYYLRDGVGLLTVFHAEDATIDAEEPQDSIFGDHWGLWLVDLEAWTAEPIEAWRKTSSNVFFSRVDDRTFLHEVSADFSETQLYEVSASGKITESLTVPGYSIVLVRVR